MSLTPDQAQQLDRLALDALDARRDQDRAAVDLATTTDPSQRPAAKRRWERRADVAQAAETRLIDAIHALVRHSPEPPPYRARPDVRDVPQPWWPPHARRRETGARNL
jgi:outer membrane PBP1 activator LpoA protein